MAELMKNAVKEMIKEGKVALGDLPELGRPQHRVGARDGSEHHAIPRGEDLVIPVRTDALRPFRQQLPAGGAEQGPFL